MLTSSLNFSAPNKAHTCYQGNCTKLDSNRYTALFVALIGITATTIGALVLGGITICCVSHFDALITTALGTFAVLSAFSYLLDQHHKTLDAQLPKAFSESSIKIPDTQTNDTSSVL